MREIDALRAWDGGRLSGGSICLHPQTDRALTKYGFATDVAVAFASVKGLNTLTTCAAAALGLAVGCLTAGAADSLFKDPIISIKPRQIDFGTVPAKTTVTNSVVVENWGGGRLTGKATVSRPFKIISGGTYQLGPADAQVVTIIYTPSKAAFDTNVVKFTGGGGALVSVVGKRLDKEQ